MGSTCTCMVWKGYALANRCLPTQGVWGKNRKGVFLYAMRKALIWRCMHKGAQVIHRSDETLKATFQVSVAERSVSSTVKERALLS
ncbi:hypothetical protein TIFTF001_031213 [Ficus carica]|uniref:Uncharacterized protein n=1 Tax=Ficus carica TaxID=3494 RepID=A0AA88J3X4_FICCA|nr:hypothetical protein TIFTF001_031213 [Ficus carica]